MTGLFLLLVVVLWIAFLIWLVPRLVRSIKARVIKVLASTILFVLLLVAPLADEIIGGMQFRSLCREGAVLTVDEEKAKGKTVFLKDGVDKNLSGYFLPIRLQEWVYLDATTHETLLSWNEYYATGGLFMRVLGISETKAPLTFNGFCRPEESRNQIFKKLNITQKQRREIYDHN